jgi:hypothetical protein
MRHLCQVSGIYTHHHMLDRHHDLGKEFQVCIVNKDIEALAHRPLDGILYRHNGVLGPALFHSSHCSSEVRHLNHF